MGIENAKTLLRKELAGVEAEIAPLNRMRKTYKGILDALGSLDSAIKAEPNPSEPKEEENPCPKCGKPNPMGAARCIHCNASMKKRR